MKIVAILAVYNEELHLSRCLAHLAAQGIQSYIIDNGSSDRTREIADSFLGRGVLHIETFPRQGKSELEPLLRRKEEVALELDADWYIHHDADEIRQAPNPYRTLAEGIIAVDRAGYNAINFDEFVFVPTGRAENYEHDRFVEEMQYYYFFEPAPQRQIKAWKNMRQRVDLHGSGGHQVSFEGRNLCPQNFILRHYIVLSFPHSVRKYCGRVYSEAARKEKGWHGARAAVRPEQIQFPERSRLHRVSDDNLWDCSNPWKVHAIFEEVVPLPSEVLVDAKRGVESRPPAPFIVGVGRSGTTLLRLMLDSHPDLAIPAETHFIPDVAKRNKNVGDHQPSFSFRSLVKRLLSSITPAQQTTRFARASFLHTLASHSRWDDFHMDIATLEARIATLDPFDLTQGLRAFYALYAEACGKPRWGDKTPLYVQHMESIWQVLPEARFIHLIRDGRDVALSVRDLWFGPNTIEEAAARWVSWIAEARRQAQNIPHYLEVRFEDLVTNPTDTLKRICDFIDLPWDPAMLSYHEHASERLMEFQKQEVTLSSDKKKTISAEKRRAIHALTTRPPEPNRIGVWKTEMTLSERKSFEAIGVTMLRELGYEVGGVDGYPA